MSVSEDEKKEKVQNFILSLAECTEAFPYNSSELKIVAKLLLTEFLVAYKLTIQEMLRILGEVLILPISDVILEGYMILELALESLGLSVPMSQGFKFVDAVMPVRIYNN